MVVEIQEIWYSTPYSSVVAKTGESFCLGGRSLPRLRRLSQLLQETEHFCRWRQEKVAKIVQYGPPYKFKTNKIDCANLMPYNSARALQLLRLGSGLQNATFRDGQEEPIRYIVEGRGRLLVVQRTGWGKSFVYLIAAKLLREQSQGPTLLISPLLALMRNQLLAAEP